MKTHARRGSVVVRVAEEAGEANVADSPFLVEIRRGAP
jgi:hypothetical protein